MGLIALVLGGLAVAAEPASGTDPLLAIHLAEWKRVPAADLMKLITEDSPADQRAAAAIALGRLRGNEAMPYLRDFVDDGDPTVRRAAIEALGFTPGSAPELLRVVEVPAGHRAWGSVGAGPDADLRVLALHGLGRQGSTDEIPALIEALAEPYPIGAAAAEALGRMSLPGRKVPGVETALPALVAGLGRLDPRTVEAFAFAIRRVSVDHPLSATDSALVADAWADAPGGSARAWLLRAAWPGMSADDHVAAFGVARRDADAAVLVTALDLLGPGEVPAAEIVPFSTARDAWVSRAAIGALGRNKTPEATDALQKLLADTSHPWTAAEAALALNAAGVPPDRDLARDVSVAAPIRAAMAAGVDDIVVLEDLVRDPAPSVRSAAAMRLTELDPLRLPNQELLNLLDADDPVVRQAALDILTQRDKIIGSPPITFVPKVVLKMRTDTDADVLRMGFLLLADHATRRPKDFDVNDKTLRDTVLRGLQHADAPIRKAAGDLNATLKLGVTGSSIRDDVQFPPDLDAVSTIRSARVFTDRGEFRIGLRPDVAPLTVQNFATLAEANYFDGIVWHRVVPGFVVQTGDPRGDGNGGPGYTLPDENSDLPYLDGAVGMALSGPDTGGSQWFVTTARQPHLDGDYTLFGYLTDGDLVVRSLQPGDRVLDVVIERVEPIPEASARSAGVGSWP